MARQGIGLLMVACEAALLSYRYAVDFFRAMVQITGGGCVPLTSASLLSHVIVAVAAEAMDLERLNHNVGDELMGALRSLSLEALQQQANQRTIYSLDAIANELHTKLLLRHEDTQQLSLESIYLNLDQSSVNGGVFISASSLSEARPSLQRVPESHLNDAYRQIRTINTTSHRPSLRESTLMTPSRPIKRTITSTSFKSYTAGPGLSIRKAASMSPTTRSDPSTPGLSFSPTSPATSWTTSIRTQRSEEFVNSDEDLLEEEGTRYQ